MQSHFVLAFSLAVLAVMVSGLWAQAGSTVQPVRYAQILSQLSQITEARKRLTSTAAQYRQRLADMKAKEQKARDACACLNTPEIVFNAHLKADVATFGIGQPLPFDLVTVNVGNGYDTRHSQFRAPVNGTYQFYVTLSTNTGYELAMDVLLNGKIITKVRTGNAHQVNSGSNGLILTMNKGDDIWVQHDATITDSNKLYKEEGLMTTFSGYLVAKS